MAAPRLVSSRSVLREEASGSADSPITTRTPVPAVSPGSPEVLVSPPQVVEPPGKSLWDQICEGHALGGIGSSWLQHGALPPNTPVPSDASCALSSQEGRNSRAQDLFTQRLSGNVHLSSSAPWNGQPASPSKERKMF
uniref:IQ motif containing K n=1 Tax=Mus musculus TaxID=10090 RepID=D6RI33_MOUSE